MKYTRLLAAFSGVAALTLLLAAKAPSSSSMANSTADTTSSKPQSLSSLTFGPDGTLYVGDSRGGAIYATATPSTTTKDPSAFTVGDLEAKIAARLGTSPSEILVHDLAVHPRTHQIFLSVSRGRTQWTNRWQLPNHVADADILLTVDAEGVIEEFRLDPAKLQRVELPNPISADKMHSWMQELSLRTDTITDLAVSGDTLFVAGLSNEEFSSALWKIPLPLGSAKASATTVEVYHGAHGEYETHAPIRTFVPYQLDGKDHILAAYLCTPLSIFEVDELQSGKHVKGRTIAELGSGNYPLDMIVVPGADGDRIALANSSLPLIMIDAADIASFEGSITERVEEYSAGVEHTKRSPTGIQQLDMLGDSHLLWLQRMPSGTLDLASQPLRRG